MKRLLCCALVLLLGLPGFALAGEESPLERAKELFTQFFAGEVDAIYEQMIPELQSAVTTEALAEGAQQLAQQVGPFEGFGEVLHESAALVQITVRMATMDLMGNVGFTEEGLISMLNVTAIPMLQPDDTLGEDEEAAEVGPYALPGVLTAPKSDGKLPAVVLVHGSGPQDRNESVGGVAVFGDIAEALRQAGIASLRYDKRSFQIGMGAISLTAEELADMTVYEDTIEDAVAAVALLKQDPRIDEERIFVLGHSQGAMLAGRIQLEGADAAGLILLAGTTRHMTELLADQLTAQAAELYAEEIRLARELPSMTEAEAREWSLLGTSAYFFWEEAQHDLMASFLEAGVPLLALQGEEDAQVYADKDFVLFEAMQAEHPEMDITLKLYAGLGHAFTEGKRVAQPVLEDIIAWVQAR